MFPVGGSPVASSPLRPQTAPRTPVRADEGPAASSPAPTPSSSSPPYGAAAGTSSDGGTQLYHEHEPRRFYAPSREELRNPPHSGSRVIHAAAGGMRRPFARPSTAAVSQQSGWEHVGGGEVEAGGVQGPRQIPSTSTTQEQSDSVADDTPRCLASQFYVTLCHLATANTGAAEGRAPQKVPSTTSPVIHTAPLFPSSASSTSGGGDVGSSHHFPSVPKSAEPHQKSPHKPHFPEADATVTAAAAGGGGSNGATPNGDRGLAPNSLVKRRLASHTGTWDPNCYLFAPELQQHLVPQCGNLPHEKPSIDSTTNVGPASKRHNTITKSLQPLIEDRYFVFPTIVVLDLTNAMLGSGGMRPVFVLLRHTPLLEHVILKGNNMSNDALVSMVDECLTVETMTPTPPPPGSSADASNKGEVFATSSSVKQSFLLSPDSRTRAAKELFPSPKSKGQIAVDGTLSNKPVSRLNASSVTKSLRHKFLHTIDLRDNAMSSVGAKYFHTFFVNVASPQLETVLIDGDMINPALVKRFQLQSQGNKQHNEEERRRAESLTEERLRSTSFAGSGLISGGSSGLMMDLPANQRTPVKPGHKDPTSPVHKEEGIKVKEGTTSSTAKAGAKPNTGWVWFWEITF